MNITEEIFIYLKSIGKFPNVSLEEAIVIDLFNRGGLDSLEALEMIIFMEQKYTVSFNQDDFLNDSFKTIKGLTTLILDKKQGNNERV
jgi:acyl carrier protein